MNSKLWRILFAWYQGAYGVVIISSRKSKMYRILQGVRQGAVLSMNLYQIYLADLLKELKHSGLGFYHNGYYLGSPCFADALVLLAMFELTLQKMVDIVFKYANRWQYSFNVTKSAILVYGKNSKTCGSMADIPCIQEAKHVGIPLINQSGVSMDTISDQIGKGRRAFFAVCGLGSTLKLPLVSLYTKLYWTICVPGMMYGCEIMSISDKQVEMFETAHRFVARRIQHLLEKNPSVICLASLGWWTLESYIDKRKLNYVPSQAIGSPNPRSISYNGDS